MRLPGMTVNVNVEKVQATSVEQSTDMVASLEYHVGDRFRDLTAVELVGLVENRFETLQRGWCCDDVAIESFRTDELEKKRAAVQQMRELLLSYRNRLDAELARR